MNDLHQNADMVASLARQLFGEPNRRLSTPSELRFGRRGSVAVVPARGVFRDYEAGVSGGVLAMVVHAGAAQTTAEAARLLEDVGAIPAREMAQDRRERERRGHADRERRTALAAALWAAAGAIRGSPVERYLRAARAVGAPLGRASIRYLANAPLFPYGPSGGCRSPAMVAAVVNSGDRFIGLHVTYLRRDGSAKADVNPSRKMVGMVGGGRISLIPGARLVVAEGIESAFSAWDAAVTLAGVSGDDLGAAAGLSAGGVASLHWPAGTTALLIAPDRDASGAGERAALALARRACAAGLSVAFLSPPVGICDWNAAAQAERARL